jgi:hypothetical protein
MLNEESDETINFAIRILIVLSRSEPVKSKLPGLNSSLLCSAYKCLFKCEVELQATIEYPHFLFSTLIWQTCNKHFLPVFGCRPGTFFFEKFPASSYPFSRSLCFLARIFILIIFVIRIFSLAISFI